MSARIVTADTPERVAVVLALFQEYASWLGFSLCFQGFDEELAALPGEYAPPAGRLLLALNDDGEPAGCVAFRPKGEAGTAELKRLYVRPSDRGTGIGRLLVEAAIDCAREAGHARLVLDTIGPRMAEAVGLYRSLGFREIDPYYDNPIEGATYMGLEL